MPYKNKYSYQLSLGSDTSVVEIARKMHQPREDQSQHFSYDRITMKLVSFCAVALLTIVAAASLPADVVVAQSTSSAAAIGYRRITGAIVDGRDAQRHSAPWIVSLQWGWSIQNTNQHCGGSIITVSWVITAAQCLPVTVFLRYPSPVRFRTAS